VFSDAPDSAARGFIYSSIIWLLVGAAALTLAAAKLVSADLFSTQLLSYPRLRAIGSISLIYGWLTQAALAATLFTVPRITGARIRERGAQMGGMLINVVVFLGVFVTLLGGPKGREFQELPPWLAALLVLALLLIAATVVRTLQDRVEDRLYPSALFMVAGAIWAPLTLAAGTLPRLSGSAAAIAHLFSLSGYMLLFLVATMVGALLYLIPRSAGNPLYSERICILAFISLGIAGPLSGQSRAMFGAAPDWLETISVAASILLLVPWFAVALNLFGTLHGAWGRLPDHPSIKFFVGGVVVLGVVVVQGIIQGFRSVAQIVGFTDWMPGQMWLMVLALSLGFAGTIVFAFPRLIGRRWFGRSQLTAQFWTTAFAAVFVALGTWGSGLATGLLWKATAGSNRPAAFGDGFSIVLNAIRPYRALFLVGIFLFLVGQVIFASNALQSTTRGEPRPLEVVAPPEEEF
jgi:cytochrome c oxidase cbb3-type subunit 1